MRRPLFRYSGSVGYRYCAARRGASPVSFAAEAS
jgi:hypothetical protein